MEDNINNITRQQILGVAENGELVMVTEDLQRVGLVVLSDNSKVESIVDGEEITLRMTNSEAEVGTIELDGAMAKSIVYVLTMALEAINYDAED